MKKIFLCLSGFVFMFLPLSAFSASNIAEKVKGRILLQVESKGEAWYVEPKTGERYYMANGNSAYNIMRIFGVGITDKDLEKLKKDKKAAIKHSGKIFLQVNSKGEAYYVDFKGNLHYLKDGIAAYAAMRNLGLGIKDSDLKKITVKEMKSGQPSPAPVVTDSKDTADQNQTDTQADQTTQNDTITNNQQTEAAPSSTPQAEPEISTPAPVSAEEYQQQRIPDFSYQFVANRTLSTVDGNIIAWGHNDSCSRPRYYDPVVVRWGDGAESILTPVNGQFHATHAYKKLDFSLEFSISVNNSCFGVLTKREPVKF